MTADDEDAPLKDLCHTAIRLGLQSGKSRLNIGKLGSNFVVDRWKCGCAHGSAPLLDGGMSVRCVDVFNDTLGPCDGAHVLCEDRPRKRQMQRIKWQATAWRPSHER